jgi:hypothetical protein
MTTEIVRASPQPPSQALSLGTMTPHDAWLFAEALANSPLLPDSYRKQPASVLWALEYGRALGLDVVTTITTIHVIKGKPTQSADLMLGRARMAGHRVRIKPERERCTVSIVRADDPDDETVIEWTLDDAVTAGLCEIRNDRPFARDDKNRPLSWEKYPRAMLRSRAVAEAVRSVCPEVLHGAIYTPEELGAYVDQEGIPVEAPVQQPQVVPHTVVERTDPPQTTEAPTERDYLDEARMAVDAAAVRVIWKAAGNAGAPKDFLDQIAEIGASKPEAAVSAPPGEDGIPDAEIVPDPDPRVEALDALRSTAAAAGVTPAELNEAFRGAYNILPEQATAEALQDFTRNLRQGTGVR